MTRERGTDDRDEKRGKGGRVTPLSVRTFRRESCPYAIPFPRPPRFTRHSFTLSPINHPYPTVSHLVSFRLVTPSGPAFGRRDGMGDERRRYEVSERKERSDPASVRHLQPLHPTHLTPSLPPPHSTHPPIRPKAARYAGEMGGGGVDGGDGREGYEVRNRRADDMTLIRPFPYLFTHPLVVPLTPRLFPARHSVTRSVTRHGLAPSLIPFTPSEAR